MASAFIGPTRLHNEHDEDRKGAERKESQQQGTPAAGKTAAGYASIYNANLADAKNPTPQQISLSRQGEAD
jgi:hypothetical protein